MARESGGRAFVDGRPSPARPGRSASCRSCRTPTRSCAGAMNSGQTSPTRRDNVLAGTAYVRELYEVLGSPGFLAAYNCGPGCYYQHLTRRRTLPAETRAYHTALAPLVGTGRSPAAPTRSCRATPWSPPCPTCPRPARCGPRRRVGPGRRGPPSPPARLGRGHGAGRGHGCRSRRRAGPDRRPAPTATQLATPAQVVRLRLRSADPPPAPTQVAGVVARLPEVKPPVPRTAGETHELIRPAPVAAPPPASPRLLIRFVPHGGWKACGSLGRNSRACVPGRGSGLIASAAQRRSPHRRETGEGVTTSADALPVVPQAP